MRTEEEDKIAEEENTRSINYKNEEGWVLAIAKPT
jgi:hypothetical protein